MKKVLVISYYFPPLGGAGVQRVVKFVKYLPQLGWEPLVLTVKNIRYPAYDSSLLEEIPKDTKIFRSGSFDPLRVLYLIKKPFGRSKKNSTGFEKNSGLKSKFSKFILIPDNKVGWFFFAVRKGLRIAKKNKIDLIFSTSPPPTAHLVGLFLKKWLKIPWVADFRDSWETSLEEKHPTVLHKWFQKTIEKKLLDNVDSVVTVNEQIQTFLQNRHPEVLSTAVITNGYDEDDFAGLKQDKAEYFTIGYLGTFNRINDPTPFLQALSELSQEIAEFKNKVKFVQVGMSLDFNLSELVQQFGLERMVKLKGYLTHKQSLRELSSASTLLLITTDSAGSEVLTTGKIFEYFRLGKPILGILPPAGAAASLIKETKAGVIVSPKNILGIKQILKDYFRKWAQGELKVELEEEKLKQFERRNLTAKLAGVFTRVIQSK